MDETVDPRPVGIVELYGCQSDGPTGDLVSCEADAPIMAEDL
jgi:hypothetical protein